MYYSTSDGKQSLDGTAGLWCVNAGHGRQEIVDAISRQAAELDYAPSFQIGHPNSFLAATAVAGLMPEGLDRIFFTNSGSESVDTALKIARSEEHTSELQSLMRISYAVFCLKKKTTKKNNTR